MILTTRHTITKEFIRFCIVGIIATIIHYGIYLFLNLWLNVNIAYTAGYIIAWGCNLYLSAHFTFRTKVSTKRGIGFALSHIVNYLLHIGLLNIFLYIGFSETLAPVPTYCLVVPINFILVRMVFKSTIFQNKEKEQA